MYRRAVRLLVTVSMTLALLAFNASPTPAQGEPSAGVSFDQSTVNPRTGDATLSGTITCSEPAFVDIRGELRQTVGRFHIIREFVGFGGFCPGPQGTSYSVSVVPQEAKYAPGPARFLGTLSACFALDPEGFCSVSFDTALDETVQLRSAR